MVGFEHKLDRFNGNEVVSAAKLQQFIADSGVSLPDDYLAFLRQANGGEGFVGAAYVILWRIEELLKFNEEYKAAEFAPELFLFGSNGGGEAFAFDLRFKEKPIVSVPFITLELEDAITMGANFREFIEALYAS